MTPIVDLERCWRLAQISARATHSLLVLDGFREDVKLHDIQGRELQAGEQVENVVLRFNPKGGTSMFVLCIWSR